MKITDHINNRGDKTLFSFEILPPLKGLGVKSIYDAIDPLLEFNPSFIDVTYHREDYVLKKVIKGSSIKGLYPLTNEDEKNNFEAWLSKQSLK